MKAEDIENYLSQLGQELQRRGIREPVHVLLIGGAYMLLLTNASRNTDDVDIFWLEEEEGLQRALRPLQESVAAIAEANQISRNWLNYMTHLLMYDLVVIPGGNLWKTYGPLHIYAPPEEYIFALKIFAGRDKDIEDCKVLLQQMKVDTRQQAQMLLNRYILPDAQQNNAETIARVLDILFGQSLQSRNGGAKS
jgi:predicted nucleotidyltransferase